MSIQASLLFKKIHINIKYDTNTNVMRITSKTM